MYAVCNVFDKSHPFYEKFERLSWEQGVPPPEVDFRGLDNKFQAYLQFCDEYKSDPENFDLKNPDFLALIKLFMDYPVSFVPSYCSIPSIQLKFAGTTSCTYTLFICICMIVDNNRPTLFTYLWIFPSFFGCNKTRIGDTWEFSIMTIPKGSLPSFVLIQITPLLPLFSPLPLLMVKSFFWEFSS
jgi:hypothetical protein